MHITLYMAMTLNGMIARQDDTTAFLSKKEWQSFIATVKQAGALITGRKSYQVMLDQGDFERFDDATVVMVSGDSRSYAAKRGHFCILNPQKAIDFLKQRGYENAILAGGGKLNAAFLRENLVDEIIVDIEPWVLGKGIPFAAPMDFEKKLKLLEVKQLSSSLVQLKYRVAKQIG